MNRWIRLIAAVVAMVMIGNLQYAWTLFVQPLMSATNWKLSEVQWGFTIFIAVMTWTMPLSGWLIDRLGPRTFMTVAGVLCGAGWASLGYVRTLPEFYVCYARGRPWQRIRVLLLHGLGLKWFPDKRGVASGLIAAGYGSGAAFFNPFFGYYIRTMGYRATFLYTGIALGVLILIAGPVSEISADGVCARPSSGRQAEDPPACRTVQLVRDAADAAVLRPLRDDADGRNRRPDGHRAGGAGGAQLQNRRDRPGHCAIAQSPRQWGQPFSMGLGLRFAGTRAHHGHRLLACRRIFLAGVATLGRRGDVWFVVTMVLVFLTWGELYVLFPAILADMFGARHAASNYSFLYSTKGLASILAGGLAAQLFERTGSWNYAFYGSAALALCSAMVAMGLHRMPLPRKAGAVEAIQPIADTGALRESSKSVGD